MTLNRKGTYLAQHVDSAQCSHVCCRMGRLKACMCDGCVRVNTLQAMCEVVSGAVIVLSQINSSSAFLTPCI